MWLLMDDCNCFKTFNILEEAYLLFAESVNESSLFRCPLNCEEVDMLAVSMLCKYLCSTEL